jgi:hypothetical protein
MVDKISQAPSNYTPPQLPEVGVNAPIDRGMDWGSIIKTAGEAYGSVKTQQFLDEQSASTENLKVAHATDKRIADISIARNIMEKQKAGVLDESDTKELARINKDYGNLFSAVEQGRQTQKGFELQAQALLRESIKRRPDLAKELNDMYSKAVGTPSLEMLQHRYFAEDLDWVGAAAKGAKGTSEADISRRTGDLLQLAKVLDVDDAQVIVASVASAQAALLDPTKGVAEAERILADTTLNNTLSKSTGDSMPQFVEATKATVGFDTKISGLRDVAAKLLPDSPEWQEIVTNMRAYESIIRAENIALANINIPASKTKMEQNNKDLELLATIQSKVDDPMKVSALLDGRAALDARKVPPDAANIVSSFLADVPKEAIAPIAQSFASGSQARQTGSHRLGLYSPSSPAGFQLFAGQLARNPKGEKLKPEEKSGAALTLSGLLADWGYPIVDATGQTVARSMTDYFDPRQGVMSSLATAIPALDNTYMTKQTFQESPRVFAANLMFMAGVIDQANLAAYKRLADEGLGQYLKRGTTMALAKEGRGINWNGALQVVGNPSSEQLKRINEVLQVVETQSAPIKNAYDRYAKLRAGGK